MISHPRAPSFAFKPRYTAFALLAACLWLSACSGAIPEPVASPTAVQGSSSILLTSTATPWLPGTPIPTATGRMPKTTTPIPTSASPARSPDVVRRLSAGELIVLSQIHMVDTLHGWAIGGASDLDQTHILRTSDGGESWDDITPPEPASKLLKNQPARTFFMDPAVAWAVYLRPEGTDATASAVVWHTEDGGQSWIEGQPVPPELTEGVPPSSIQFVDLNKGWMTFGAAHPSLLSTDDGGRSWVRMPSWRIDVCTFDPFTGQARAVFLNRIDGWLLQLCDGLFELQETSTGGDDWREIPLPPPQDQQPLVPPSASCLEASLVLSERGIGMLAFTCQGAAGWKGGLLYRTQDDGQTWEILPCPGGRVSFLDENIGWALSRDIYKTTDGGASWTKIKQVSWDGQFSFVDEQQGWAVARSGEQSSLVRTDDGGRTWQELLPIVGGSLSLRSIKMFDSLHGWAMAGSSDEARRILRTVDGGQTWEDVSPTSPGGISDKWNAIDAHHAWVRVDGEQESVTLCRTHDGGEVWACDTASGVWLSHAFYVFLSDITFVDELNGWLSAVGAPAAGSVPLGLFHTQDGGQTWREVGDDPYDPWLWIPNAPFAISFVSPRTGWLLTGSFANAHFSLARTDNAGRTWVEVDVPPTPSEWGDLNHYCTYGDGLDLLFSSPSAGIFAVGFDECKIEDALAYKVVLYTTDDGGRSWNAHSAPEPDLPDLSTGLLLRETAPYLATADIAWIGVRDLQVVGGHAEILEQRWYRTADGGRTWVEAEGIGEKQGYTDLSKLDFVDNQTGWALVKTADESTGLFMTQDGGLTWTDLHPQWAP